MSQPRDPSDDRPVRPLGRGPSASPAGGEAAAAGTATELPEELTQLLNSDRLRTATGEKASEAVDRPEIAAAMMRWYDELKQIAAAQLRRESKGHTLQPTALVHEAFLRLAKQRKLEKKSRSEMLALGAQLMRRVLVDHARRKKADKRGGGRGRVLLTDEVSLSVSPQDPIDIVVMDDLIQTLGKSSDRAARVVELRFFGGLTTDEIAESINVSPRTVDNDWKFARAWIRREMARGEGSDTAV